MEAVVMRTDIVVEVGGPDIKFMTEGLAPTMTGKGEGIETGTRTIAAVMTDDKEHVVSSRHDCIDSSLKRDHSGHGTVSPKATPPSGHTTRFPPPEAERHYTSHRCHHQSHQDHDRSSRKHSATSRSRDHHHRRHHRHRSPSPAPAPVKLPFGARVLSRWDFAAFEPLFTHYMELHQQVRISDLEEDAVRDHWKGFVAKWNAGELDSAWYEPEMILRVVRLRATAEARARAAGTHADPGVMTPPMTGVTFSSEAMQSVSDMAEMTGVRGITKKERDGTIADVKTDAENDDDDDDDDYAPPLPPPLQLAEPPGRNTGPLATSGTQKTGPAIPSLQDLELRRTLEAEAEEDRLASLRLARRADRVEQKERLEEVAPRPEAGTRERQLEKRRVTTEVMRQFASAREAGDMEEVGDRELIGGGDGAEDYRRMLANLQRRKTDREVRREEIVRARNAERDERVREYRAREEGTVEMLREIARQRFG